MPGVLLLGVAFMVVGALGGMLVGSVAAIVVGRGLREPERFTRPCLIVGAAVGASIMLVCFVTTFHGLFR